MFISKPLEKWFFCNINVTTLNIEQDLFLLENKTKFKRIGIKAFPSDDGVSSLTV